MLIVFREPDSVEKEMLNSVIWWFYIKHLITVIQTFIVRGVKNIHFDYSSRNMDTRIY